jgi:hypothetical protein
MSSASTPSCFLISAASLVARGKYPQATQYSIRTCMRRVYADRGAKSTTGACGTPMHRSGLIRGPRGGSIEG